MMIISPVWAQTNYTVTYLGVLPGQIGATGTAVNNLGHICGYSGSKAFFWSPETGMVELPGLGPRVNQIAWDLNDSDVVAGTSGIDFLGPQANRAVRWRNGVVEDLGTLPGGSRSQGFGINDSGWVVGYGHYYLNGNEYWRPTLYRDGFGMDTLSGVTGGYAYDVNNLGQVVGYSSPGAYIYMVSTGAQYLPAPAGWVYTRAAGISRNGLWVAGTVINGSGNSVRFARWSSATGWQMFGLIGNAGMSSINDAGDCVGGSSSILTGYRYTESTGLHDINDFIAPESGWVITSTTDINNAGQITGSGQNTVTQQAGAILLTPLNLDVNPPRIADLTIRSVNDSVRLAWSAATGAERYNIHSDGTADFIPSPINLVLSTSATNVLLPASNSIAFFTVIAVSTGP
jgi:uncharacterized membrane protein